MSMCPLIEDSCHASVVAVRRKKNWSLTNMLVVWFKANFWLAFKNITCSHEMFSYKPPVVEEE